MKKSMMKTAAVALSGVMAMSLLTGCGEAKLDGTKTVATVDSTNIPMGVLSLAVRTQQASLEYMYSYYIQAGYMSSIWDQTLDEDSDETYGQQTISSILEEVEEMYLLKDHAADYGVELTSDDEKAIADAAAKFMEDNTEDTIKELSITEDQVKEYLELLTYRERMETAIKDEADTTVSDDEAQQSSFTYVNIPLDEEEDTADADAAEEDTDADAEDDAAAEDTADADAEATEDDADNTDADEAADTTDDTTDTTDADADEAADTADADAADTADTEVTGEDADTADTEDTKSGLEKAEELLTAMQADPAADMTEAAQAIDETLTSSTGTFFVNESEYSEEEGSTYPDELIAALKELKDGELVSEVITTDDGYYVARLDQVFDEDATEHEKEHIASHKQEDHYTEVTDGWKESAKITVDDKVLAALTLTDSHTFTLKVEEATEDEEETDETDPIDEELAEDAEVLDDESTAPEATDAEEPDAEDTDADAETDETDSTAETDTTAEADAADETEN